MNELKPGMYVRTLTLSGFSRIGKLLKIDDICVTDNGAVDKTQIIKASFNITDLIEVGDYVNGKLVGALDYDYTESVQYLLCNYTINRGYEYVKKEEIKSIVTKEMMESMSYKVGD